MRVAALYSSPGLPSRYDARARRRSRGTVHPRGARRETAAHGYLNVVGAVRRYKIARERERDTRLTLGVWNALPLLPLPLPMLHWLAMLAWR